MEIILCKYVIVFQRECCCLALFLSLLCACNFLTLSDSSLLPPTNPGPLKLASKVSRIVLQAREFANELRASTKASRNPTVWLEGSTGSGQNVNATDTSTVSDAYAKMLTIFIPLLVDEVKVWFFIHFQYKFVLNISNVYFFHGLHCRVLFLRTLCALKFLHLFLQEVLSMAIKPDMTTMMIWELWTLMRMTANLVCVPGWLSFNSLFVLCSTYLIYCSLDFSYIRYMP